MPPIPCGRILWEIFAKLDGPGDFTQEDIKRRVFEDHYPVRAPGIVRALEGGFRNWAARVKSGGGAHRYCAPGEASRVQQTLGYKDTVTPGI